MALFDLLFGIGIFLLGMARLEESVQTLGGNTLKRWLAQRLSTLGSVLSGIGITAVLQSSTLVSLLVLAFAAAGSVPFSSAIAVMAGATLGTTSTGWLVTTLGFKLSLESAAIPLLGGGALAAVLVNSDRRLHHLGWGVIGFALLLLGLGLMKSAAEGLPELFGSGLATVPPLPLYFLVGAVLTALIQSSTATSLLCLTMLHGGLITLPQAMLVVAGANMGTSSTLLLVTIGGASVRRRLALGNLLYHIFTSLVALLLWLPLQQLLADTDPLLALMMFHSLFALVALVLFLPVLRPFSHWLETRFREPERERVAPWLSSAAAAVPEAAIHAAERALRGLLLQVLALNSRNLQLPPLPISTAEAEAADFTLPERLGFEPRYERIKRLEGELQQFVRTAQGEKLEPPQAAALMRCTTAARDAVFAAKGLKDVRSNLMELRHHEDDTIGAITRHQRAQLQALYSALTRLLVEPHDARYVDERLAQLLADAQRLYDQTEASFYTASDSDLAGDGTLLSTLLNVNRQLWSASTNLIHALRLLHDNNAIEPALDLAQEAG